MVNVNIYLKQKMNQVEKFTYVNSLLSLHFHDILIETMLCVYLFLYVFSV